MSSIQEQILDLAFEDVAPDLQSKSGSEEAGFRFFRVFCKKFLVAAQTTLSRTATASR